MKLNGESRVAKPREAIATALTDAAAIARCFEHDAASAASPSSLGMIRLGGVAATLAIDATTSGDRHVVNGRADAGDEGALIVSAEFALADAGEGGGTLVRYAISSSATGRLAAAAAVDEDEARSRIDAALARLGAHVEPPTTAAVLPVADPGAPIDDTRALHGSRRRTGLTPLVWVSVLIIAVVLVLVWELQ